MMNPKDNIEKLINDKDCQFRDFKLTKIEQRKADNGDNELVVEGKACSFNDETVLYKMDDYEAREIIDSSALSKCDMSDVIFNYNHSGRVYARTRNNTLSLEVREDGIYMRAVLRADDNGHKEHSMYQIANGNTSLKTVLKLTLEQYLLSINYMMYRRLIFPLMIQRVFQLVINSLR